MKGFDWGPISQIGAATIAGLFLLRQHGLNQRAERRDKLRDAYSEWMAALSRARRTEEKLLGQHHLALDAMRALREAGDPLATAGALDLTPDGARAMAETQRELDITHHELDVAMARVCLLDNDRARMNAADAVARMVTLKNGPDGAPQTWEDFDERWDRKSRALWFLANRINRTLALESVAQWKWDGFERDAEAKSAAMHKRVNATLPPDAPTRTREDTGQV